MVVIILLKKKMGRIKNGIKKLFRNIDYDASKPIQLFDNFSLFSDVK